MQTLRSCDGNTATITDESIGVRVTLDLAGNGSAESTRPRMESMMIHSERIDQLTAEAEKMLRQHNQNHHHQNTNTMQVIKINVSKIDKDALYTGKSGKYLDLVLFDNKDGVDQYGNEGFVVQDLPKSRREAGEKGPIIGNWKHIVKKGQAAPAPLPMSKAGLAQTSLDPDGSGDDVPF